MDQGQWLDSLLPPNSPAAIERLLQLTFVDQGSQFKLGPVDQLIAALIEAVFSARVVDQHLIIAVPRGDHDLAMLSGFLAQLLRVQAWKETSGAGVMAFSGPVIVVGRDTAVQSRLAAVRLRGTRFEEGMAGAVSACRVRADGRVVEADGIVVPYVNGHRRLLYVNSRVGWPDLDAFDGFGVVDRTTLRNRETFRSALDWTRSRCTRTVTVADLGDSEVEAVCRESGLKPLLWPISPAVLGDLNYVLGPGEGDSRMTANSIIKWTPDVTVKRIEGADELEQELRVGYATLADASSVGGTYPYVVRVASRLLSAVQSCVVDIEAYGAAASGDPRIMAGSPRSMALALERQRSEFHGPWRGFGATSWAALKGASLRAHNLCREHNPKRAEFVEMVEMARRRDLTSRILLRVPNQAAGRVLRSELVELSVFDERMSISPWSDRTRWREHDLEIWCGLPPWHHRSVLLSAEADRFLMAAYRGEIAGLANISRSIVGRLNDGAAASADWLGVNSPPLTKALVRVPEVVTEVTDPSDHSLTVDFERIVANATKVQDSIGDFTETKASEHRGEPTQLRAIGLDNESFWWLADDDAVGVLSHDRYVHRLVPDLHVGDLVVVPRGEGREELFSRLVEVIHGSSEVADLDFMLARFRKACGDLYRQCGSNWAEGNRRLQRAGAAAGTQLRPWATGETIAPANAKDVQVIAQLVHDPDLERGWRGIEAVARELRGLHRRLGRVISAALTEAVVGEGPNLGKVEHALKTEALEVLDEFAVHQITSIGELSTMPAGAHGSVTKEAHGGR